ncbi:hypothetical protein EVAR_16049_1 [Eumeta japonica]|uniref:Uncharacterized protein n=1 Tax=Eumeta variegata TaxID=151549 RepID=A0A4C1VZY3_EUMVA|nr:hypothetical protein EVAR_16049_1 [Eumeta japonica]
MDDAIELHVDIAFESYVRHTIALLTERPSSVADFRHRVPWELGKPLVRDSIRHHKAYLLLSLFLTWSMVTGSKILIEIGVEFECEIRIGIKSTSGIKIRNGYGTGIKAGTRLGLTSSSTNVKYEDINARKPASLKLMDDRSKLLASNEKDTGFEIKSRVNRSMSLDSSQSKPRASDGRQVGSSGGCHHRDDKSR